MKITISQASPDALNHDTLILGFFSDERPPKGYCGLVDWRLNGMISTEISQGRISGDFLEKLLYAFPKRIRISRLLLFGLGSLSELTYDRLYNAGYEMARTVSGIRGDDLVLPVPAAGRGPLNLSGMTEALITGIFDGFACKPEELSSSRVEIPVKADHADAIRAGLDRFREHVGATEIEILESEERSADGTDIPDHEDSEKKLM
jgi:Cytosol aminopeptidase family, N-terminal domain